MADVLTRPRVVLGLRVLWDVAFGVFMLLVVQGILAYREDVLIIGVATLAAGGWGAVALLRPKPAQVCPTCQVYEDVARREARARGSRP